MVGENYLKNGLEKVDTWQLGYNHSTYAKAGNFIFTSYHTGIRDENGKLLETIEEQTEQCFKELLKTLSKAGATAHDIVKMNVYLRHQESRKDKQDEFRKMDKVYEKFFTNSFPVRMGIWTSFFEERCLIQLEAIAYKE